MTERSFATWVQPTAARLRESRTRVLEYARSLPAEAWSRPTGNEGWTCKDILAHIGGGNDRMFQKILRSVLAREPLDPALLRVDTDAENARGVTERRSWSVVKVIAELESTGEEIQELLSGLHEDDKDLHQDEFPMSLGEFLHLVYEESHDLEHLAQLRKALET